MDYIKIRFGGGFGQLQSELEETLNNLYRTASPVFSGSSQGFRPATDVFETPDEIVVMAEMAGVNKDELSIELDSRAVKISGRRKEIRRGAQARFHLAEIPYGYFERTLFFPRPVDPEKVTATYAEGMLEIRVAKAKTLSPQRVQIQD